MQFIEECSTFKYSKTDYKASLGYFTRGNTAQKGPATKANVEDISAALKKYTDMSDSEIKDFVGIHDTYDLISILKEAGMDGKADEHQMIDIEESTKLMYKY